MRSKTSARTVVVGIAAIIASVALIAYSMAAQAAGGTDLHPRYQFKIPAEPLDAALTAFSAQTAIKVVTSGAPAEVLSPGVRGEVSSLTALTALLRGTGLSFRSLDAQTIVVVPARVAKLRPTQFQLVGDANADALADQPAAAAAPAAGAQSELSEVQVTGTRIIRQGNEAPTPVSVVSLQDLNDQANPNISATLNEQPVFQGSSVPATNGDIDSSGSQTNLNLRDLGTTRTLILFDGRRMPSDNITNVVDVDLIPDGVIQRVDVVTGGASAVYGSDAVAGVVNYVLDTTFTGIKGVVQGGVSGYGDGGSDKIQLTAGTTFFDGRLHLLVSGDQDYQAEIPGTARSWNTRGVQDIQNPNYTSTNGQPQYIHEPCCVAIYGYYPGGIILNGALRGTDFGVGGQVGQYNFGSLVSGSYNVGGDWQSATFAGSTDLMPSMDATHVFARLAFDITSDTQAYAELINAQDRTDARCCYSYYPSGLTVSPYNAYLPASVSAQAIADGLSTLSVGTSLRFPSNGTNNEGGLGNDGTRTDDIYVAGLRGKFDALKSPWNWNLWFQQGVGVQQYYVPAQAINANLTNAINAVTVGSYHPGYSAAAYPNPLNIPNGAITCLSNLLPVGTKGETSNCAPYNIFGLGAESPAAYAYALGGPWERQQTTQSMAGGDITGEPFSTWAGPVSVALDVEYRREAIAGNNDPISSQTGYFSTQLIAFDADQHVEEGALETVVPLLKGAPGAQELDLNGAARGTDYSTSGYVTSWKYGVEWTPVSDLRFRATESRDIRAPNLNDLFAAPQVNHNTIPDPFNNNTNSPYYTIALGNPNLKAEKAHETEIGFVFQPSEVPGFGLSVDWWRINVLDAISSVTAQFELTECLASRIDGSFTGTSPYCANIARNPNGSLYSVATQGQNIASYLAEGVDYEADYHMRLARIVSSWPGALDLHFTATNTQHVITNTGIPGPAQVLDAAGTGNAPRWALFGSLAYDLDPWRFVWIERYYSSVLSADNYIVCQSNCPVPVPAGFMTAAYDPRVPTYFLANLSVQYKFVEHDQQEAEAFVSVNNLFNKIPPFNYGAPGPQYPVVTNISIYDAIGLYVRAGVRFKF